MHLIKREKEATAHDSDEEANMTEILEESGRILEVCTEASEHLKIDLKRIFEWTDGSHAAGPCYDSTAIRLPGFLNC